MVRAKYAVDVPLRHIAAAIDEWVEDLGLELEPDFQRGHVWTPVQQSRFIEHLLRGGISGRDIYLNHPGWRKGYKGDFVLVDGLQRLTAARRFLAGEIPVFGRRIGEFADEVPISICFRLYIADLQTRAEVLNWYIGLNEGGVVHSEEEIARASFSLPRSRSERSVANHTELT